jgi:hypothetical protein
MSESDDCIAPETGFWLRFESLVKVGHTYDVPCNREGQVDLDSLGVVALNDYLYARTVIGREFSMPTMRFSAPT